MTPHSFGHFVLERLPELWLRTGEHLMLTGCSTATAMLLGIPLGILLFRVPLLRTPAMGVVGVLQTIPSLAMLAFLLALLHKIGVLPALIALTLYALLPIVRNALTGLEGVSKETMEAAEGLGMTPAQQLRMVRLPLASPVIVAGIRTAAVVSVGIATLSAFIGAGGLGQFINRGLALSDTRLILLGAVPAAILALLVDFSIGALEWGLRWERKKATRKPLLNAIIRHAALLAPFLLMMIGLWVYFSQPFKENTVRPDDEESGVVRIGTKNFTEQLILGEMMAQVIEAKTDLKVLRRFNLGGTMICHGALLNGEIDLYPEYTGTGLVNVLKSPLLKSPRETLSFVRKAYADQFGLTWLEPFGFNNTYAITVRAKDARNLGLETISNLRKFKEDFKAGFTAEFAEREDGYPGLRKAYGFGFKTVLDLDPSMMYQAVKTGEIDVICAFSTDGRIKTFDLTVLRDDRGFFPPYQATPVVSMSVLDRYPALEPALTLLKGRIDDQKMQHMNSAVDSEKQPVREVVAKFLQREGILKAKPLAQPE